MSAVKYKQYYQQMLEQNAPAFAEFKKTHDAFVADRVKGEEKFHTEGIKILDIIRDWDRRLCSAMGRGKFSSYTQTLSEKFWNEVRKEYSLIDLVGVRVRKVKV
jgi:hypothetical protein